MPCHGIYMMSSGFIIEDNRIDTVINDGGNGISVRSNGIIRRNLVTGATKAGISYYSDHPSAGTILVENNIVYDNATYGIAILSNGTASNHINGATLRFNTLLTANSSSIKLDTGISDIAVEIYGNIFIRTDGSGSYIYDKGGDADVQSLTANLEASGDAGFTDFSGRDMHIIPGSAAGLFNVDTAPEYPLLDFDGETRSVGSQYAGADDPDSNL